MRNRPFLLSHRGFRAMAAMLLLAGVTALSSGCLVLEDDPVFPDLPAKKNTPVRIVLNAAITPADRVGPVYVGGKCSAAGLFSVQAFDDDLPDTLHSLWFVDPQASHKASASSPVFPGRATTPGAQKMRTLSSPAGVANQLSTLMDQKRHIVEVWVTDGEFKEDSVEAEQPNGLLPDGGSTPVNEYFTDSYLWLVEAQPCP